ncbi:MAG: hypothetical protein H6696_16990 [Deferribacteres bacterium]|nr:hypothetical protein [candidate division KSB1 bacterium]MCB9503631.1 hypothetical protein [Deferribacteres bacterium]
MPSLPFRIPSLYADLGKAEGTLSFEHDALTIEIQTSDSIIGLLKSGVKEFTVPLSEVSEVLFKSTLFSNKIYLRGKKMSTFANVPGYEKGELLLTIARKHKETAANFVVDLQIRIQEINLKKMESDDLSQ